VLLLGGADNAGIALATAELYDPTSGTFTAAGNMAQARILPSAILLANGKVLVCGGANASGTLATAEIYDPTTDLFTFTGNLNQGRARQTMSLLPNGRVLVAGGRTFSGPPTTVFASAEIFNPTANNGAGAFTAISNMNSPRDEARATLLGDGQVLIVGGFVSYETGLSASSAEVFNPATNTFTLTGNMSAPRAHPTASVLPDGRVLVTGGVPNTGNTTPATTSADIFNPAAGTFTATGPMATAREYSGVVVLGANALISGGDDGINTTATQEIFYSTAVSALLVNTGPGNPTTAGGYALFASGSGGNFQFLAGQFTLTSGATLDSVQAWMDVGGVGGSLEVKISADNSGVPGTSIFSKIYTLGFQPLGWALFSNYNVGLAAGKYWVSFEPVAGSAFGGLPVGAPNPLQNYAFFYSANNRWLNFSVLGSQPGLGIRISGTSP